MTASKDHAARVWKVDTGALLIVLRGHRDVVTSAAFGRTGRNVVTASADGTARVWDGVVQPELEVLATLPAPVKEVVAAAGYRVVAADDRAHVLDPVTGEERRSEPAGHVARRPWPVPTMRQRGSEETRSSFVQIAARPC